MSEPEEPPTLAEDLAIDEYEDLRKAADREASGDAPAGQDIEGADAEVGPG